MFSVSIGTTRVEMTIQKSTGPNLRGPCYDRSYSNVHSLGPGDKIWYTIQNLITSKEYLLTLQTLHR